jgi:hypothetical protein
MLHSLASRCRNARLIKIAVRHPFAARFPGSWRAWCIACCQLVFIASMPTDAGAEPSKEGNAFFEQKIRPILVEHCYACHSQQAEKLKSNLYLDSKEGWERGGDYGEPAIVPGDPARSLLLRSIRHLEPGLEMPPDRPKLPDSVIADLVTWIQMGAPDPRQGEPLEIKRGDKSWWSLQPLRQDFSHDTIDGFIAEKLLDKQLTRNPPADARSLIRRMSYDVTGLPPTPEQVADFAAAYASQPAEAVDQLIERLLASPQYGERWGRHWLDVIRFGESNGFERNFVIDDLYPFRDYVIRAFNDDKPFDQFIVEHLAGDVLGKDQPEIEIGSAFLVAGPYDDVGNQDKVAQANIRAATLDDMITATASAFLGLTVNCARCHNHKFDPIPAEDYYRLRAAFEGVTHGRRVVASAAEQKAYEVAIKPLNQQAKKLELELADREADIARRAEPIYAAMKFDRPKVDSFGTEESFEAIEAKYLRFVIHSFTSDYQNAARPAAGGGKLTEFQVWTDEAEPRNVALASYGTVAEGAKSAVAEDFPEAYGPQYCIDGKRGEAWFIGQPPILTLTFPRLERIHRVYFINARGDRGTDESKVRGATPCEYEIQVSLDGKDWQTVATDEGREPWTQAHGLAKAKRQVITDDDRRVIAKIKSQLAAVRRQIAEVPPLKSVWAGKFSQPQVRTFLHQGGDPMKPLHEVNAGSLSVLDQGVESYSLDADAPEGERRLALGRWLTHPGNPLTPRVLANRVWQYHFGTGIVDTPSDFGFLGSQPTHPELLDFLAQRLRQHQWRLKPLHREILRSKSYLQSAASRPEGLQADKDSRWLWRFPPRRLTGEELRDTLLSIAGKLQLEPMGGPGFRLYKFTQNNVCTYFPLDQHGPETYRRAVYHQNARASVVDILTDFDLPDIAFAAPKRANTTTPLQALTLLNHRFSLDMADALGSRLGEQEPVVEAFQLLFQRPPTSQELDAANALIAGYGRRAFCRALLNSNELLYLE